VLLYVLANFRKHARRRLEAGIDAYSSAAWFDGWREWAPASGLPPPLVVASRPPWLQTLFGGRGAVNDELAACPVVAARTWLAGQGWRRHGLLRVAEVPAG
jgi:hypothetical protein